MRSSFQMTEGGSIPTFPLKLIKTKAEQWQEQ
jgi:hypothetical protein